MQHFITILFFILASTANGVFGQTNSFDTSHFYSKVDKAQFDTLRGTDFTSIIFEQINDTLSGTPEQRAVSAKTLSDKQKALFYIWELERAVYGGEFGFVNFYWNYKSNYQETINALKLINDTAMVNVLEGVNKVYLSNYKKNNRKLYNGGWKYVQRRFKKYDKAFLGTHEETMKLLEGYVRRYTNDFVRFKNN